MTIRYRAVVRLITLLMFSIIGTLTVICQTSTITGIVLDPQGNALSGVQITITDKDKNISREVTTNASGKYQVPQIAPGNYRVRAEAKGFSSLVEEDVQVLINTPLTLNLQFTKLGEITDIVNIQSEGSLINASDATIGNNFTSRQIINLPLDTRNIVELLSLQPGVSRGGSVTGSRSDQANVILDGVDINEQQTGLDPISSMAFSSVLRSTPDSVQEFRVTTTNPNANQGRSSGGQVELVTNSGTNRFHGSLFEFNRNDITAANNFFNNRVGIAKPKYNRNLFGGSVGGPIKKDRVFFFYTYEGRRDAEETTVFRTVPLASLGRGELSFLEKEPDGTTSVRTLRLAELNALFPDVGMNPIALAALADAARKYPANDFETEGDSLNFAAFRFNAPVPLKWNTHITRIDFNLTSNQNLFIRGNYQQDSISQPPNFPDTPIRNFWHHPYGYSIGHTWTLNSNLVNKINYGLTRLSFSNQGDSDQNNISFRFIFQPLSFARTSSRKTPVHNFTDDLSWVKGNHTFQFGTNIRLVRNIRTNFGSSYDSAVTNPSFYDLSGAVLSDPIQSAFPNLDESSISPVQAVMAAMIGRFSQYTANFNFDRDGSPLPSGTGVDRTFATEQYDWYAQDSWKIGRNLTLNVGLRYGLGSPVYEANGFQVKPTTPLGEYFERRKASAARGVSYNTPIEIDIAGPANNRKGFYPIDTNNFQPRISAAWSPNFNKGFLKKIFGESGKSVFRGGFAMTHDQIGQQLAVFFDQTNTLGFTSDITISANTYNVTDRPGPLFTKYGQNVQSLPGITIPSRLVFPLTTPSDGGQRIESSLDENIVTPINYSWNFSYSREFPLGLTIEGSYIGRKARNLLATRDIMALNNLVDPKSGMDWYTAATKLVKLREANTPISSVAPIPYFENLFPNYTTAGYKGTQAVYRRMARTYEDNDPTKTFIGGNNIADYTFVQLLIDDRGIFPNAFFHPQYAAFSTFSTIGRSDYHAGTLSVRQRLRNQLDLDFNYTFSQSMDTASGLQTSGGFGAAFILNSLLPENSRAESDFDVRHIINANAVWKMPFGRGKKYLTGIPKALDAFLGGWQLSSIFRWNSGLPATACCTDKAQWATNWNVQSNGVRIKPLKASPDRKTANIFSDPEAAYRSFRNAYPGETGDRNFIRLPGYVVVDMGLLKSFTMPWSEAHKLEFKWETFNITNTQRLGGLLATRDGVGLDIDSHIGAPAPSFGNLTEIQGDRRTMQFSLRYKF